MKGSSGKEAGMAMMEERGIERNDRKGKNREEKGTAKGKDRRMSGEARLEVVLLISSLFLVLFTAFMIIAERTKAEAEVKRAETEALQGKEVHYKSVEVREGDSLWKIAEEWKPEGIETQTWIDRIMEINNLSNSKLLPDTYLIVPYI